MVTAGDLHELEPALTEDLSGGVFYEQDCQVQPVAAVDFLVRQFGARGGLLVRGAEVVGAEHDRQGNVCSVRTTMGTVGVDKFVVNAAGPWAGEVARHLGTDIPVVPRRGHVLVTEPEPLFVRHKVYEAGYVSTVHDDGTGLACSAVVEATRSGTMLLGSSREFVGFSREIDPGIMRTIAARGVALFPDLGRAPPDTGLCRLPPDDARPAPHHRGGPLCRRHLPRHGPRGSGHRPGVGHRRDRGGPSSRREAFCGPGAVRPRALCLWHSSWRNECHGSPRAWSRRGDRGGSTVVQRRCRQRRPVPDIKTGQAETAHGAWLS